jgi:hypothetical protein
MNKCERCNCNEAKMYKEHCFECYAQLTIEDVLKFEGRWIEYDRLSNDVERTNGKAWVLKDTLYLF